MLRLRYLNNKFQKRTLRVEYNQFRTSPFAGVLDPAIGTGVNFTAPSGVFTLQGGLVPGQVMLNEYESATTVQASGNNDVFTVANAAIANGTATAPVTAYGLLANFVGGNLDELADENYVGIWNGVGSVVELIAPAFNSAGGVAVVGDSGVTTSAFSSASTTPGAPTELYAGVDGRLGVATGVTTAAPVAQLLQVVSPNLIRVRLLV